MRLIFLRLGLAVLGALLPLIFIEGSYRAEKWFRVGRSPFFSPRDLWDPELGWHPKEHRLGDPHAQQTVLVLGDSFTDGLGVPTEKMWFAPLVREFGSSRVIAVGGQGYGPLQELMILRRWKHVADRIVVQLCSNDILNSNFELERRTLMQRAPAPRPYLENGEIVYRFPRSMGSLVWFGTSYSWFLHRQAVRYEMKMAEKARAGELNTIENDIQREGYASPFFRDGVRDTSKVLSMLKEEVGEKPLVFLLIDDVEPYTRALRDIARELNVPILLPLRGVRIPREHTLSDGAHLNEEGNASVGRRMIELGRNAGIW
jgi:lysophospholipase L1-like esterase